MDCVVSSIRLSTVAISFLYSMLGFVSFDNLCIEFKYDGRVLMNGDLLFLLLPCSKGITVDSSPK